MATTAHRDSNAVPATLGFDGTSVREVAVDTSGNVQVSIVPSAGSTGMTLFRSVANLNTTGNQAKGSAGKLVWFTVRNTDANNPLFVNVRDGLNNTATIVAQIELPPSSAYEGPLTPIPCSTGIFITLSSSADGTVNPVTAINQYSGGYV